MYACDLMFSTNHVNLPGRVCEMRLVMVVNISAGHKHVGPHFKQDSSCVSVRVCVCLYEWKTNLNTHTNKDGVCTTMLQ